MASIPELLDGHVTLEVECLDRLYMDGYFGPLATSGGLVSRATMFVPYPSASTRRANSCFIRAAGK
jgi:hypothetical protein